MPLGPNSYQNSPPNRPAGQQSESGEEKGAGVLFTTEETQRMFNFLQGLNEAIPATDETAEVKGQLTEIINIIGGKMNAVPNQGQAAPPPTAA